MRRSRGVSDSPDRREKAPPGGPRERVGDRRAEALRHLLGEALLYRVVDDLLGLDDIARHRVQGAEAVGEPELDALLAGPEEAAEHVGCFLQALAASLAHHVDELPV